MSSINKIEIPLIEANNKNLEGYGYLVDDFDKCRIEIVTWPKQGWRDIEKGTGNEGGKTEGPFEYREYFLQWLPDVTNGNE